MDGVSVELVAILKYLLPGFLSAWVFYGMTSYAKPSQFERVVQALIFTIFIQVMLGAASSFLIFVGRYHSFGLWSDDVQLFWSILFAVLIGFVFSFFANNDKAHAVLRKFKLTRETSYASEWYGVFKENTGYVVLHLEGERRLMGWPVEWPSDPCKGHFVLANASWLIDNGQVVLEQVSRMLVPVSSVKWVEFVEADKGELL